MNNRRLALAQLLAASLLLWACSRAGSSDEAPGPGAASALPAQPSLGPAPATATAPDGAAPVLTPEDLEEETGHRITEQNLESELDRLEREIQAE